MYELVNINEVKMKEYILEKSWTTEEGYQAAIIKTNKSWTNHRCGYIGVPKSHPLFGKGYSQHCDVLIKLREEVKKEPIGDRGIIPVFYWDGESASMDVLFNVHGGVTYAETGKEYPLETEEELHWIGYDCAHVGDTDDKCTLSFCEEQCIQLSEQIKKVEKFAQYQKYRGAWNLIEKFK